MATYNVSTAFRGIDRVSNAFINMGRSARKFRGVANKSFSGASKGGFRFGAMLGALSIGLIARKIKNFTSESIKLFDTQAAAVANVEVGLKSTAGIAGRTLKQLKQQASDLQANTFFGDETILQNSTAQLLTFTNITGKTFDRTQKVVLDLTAKLKGLEAGSTDMKASSILLGKALNDPVANLGALGRVGIQFSTQQKAQIKMFAKSGNLAKAQGLILGELERQYGGTAEALAKTAGGMALSSKNLTGDVKELIGGALSPLRLQFLQIFNKILPKAIPFIQSAADKIKIWTEANKELINTKVVAFFQDIGKFIKKIIPYIKTVFRFIKNNIPLLKKIAAAFLIWKAAVLLVTAGLAAMQVVGMAGMITHLIVKFITIASTTGIWSAAQWVLNAAMAANPVGLITAGIVALIAVVVIVIKYWDRISAALMLSWEWFKKNKAIVLALLGPFGIMIDAFIHLIGNIKNVIKAFKTGFINGLKAVGRAIFDFVLFPLKRILELIAKIPGVGKIAASALHGIEGIETKIFGEENKTKAPNAAKEEAKRDLGKGSITVKAEKGTEVTDIESLAGADMALAGIN